MDRRSVFRATWYLALALLLATGGRDRGRAAGQEPTDLEAVVTLLELIVEADPDSAAQSLATIRRQVQSGELPRAQSDGLRARLQPLLRPLLERTSGDALTAEAVLLAASWGEPAATIRARDWLGDRRQPVDRRGVAADALVAGRDPELLPLVARILTDTQHESQAFRGTLIAALGQLEAATVAEVVLDAYSQLEPVLQPKAIELLTQRGLWSKPLVAAVRQQRIPASAVHVNQVQRLALSPDRELQQWVTEIWGAVRSTRHPEREQVIADVRELVRHQDGDPHRGQELFHKICGQCHKIHGQGQDVGPDITLNGRNSFEQLLSNVLDPSLVIGASYQARTVQTTDGRVLTGLVAEDNAQRIILKLQGGKLETIPREEVDGDLVSQLSLMPEGLEKQLTAEELRDLFAFLMLDKPPADPAARRLPLQ